MVYDNIKSHKEAGFHSLSLSLSLSLENTFLEKSQREINFRDMKISRFRSSDLDSAAKSKCRQKTIV